MAISSELNATEFSSEYANLKKLHMKHLFFLLILFSINSLLAQQAFRTKIFQPNIKTLIAENSDEPYALPIIELGSQQQLIIRFDEMSHETHAYSYTVHHCTAEWTLSDLTTNEYQSGYTQNDITHYERSMSTSYLYTHYRFELPNQDVQLKLSGNYVVMIYEDNDRSNPVAHVCFSIVEPKVGITAVVRPNTDIEINGRYQQIDFEVLLSGYPVRDPASEIKTVVRQNNRIDSEVRSLRPTVITNNKLGFQNNRALIFEAGNEFHSFDISSVYAASRRVDKMLVNNQRWEALLSPDQLIRGTYRHEPDLNGRFIIHHQEAFYDSHIEGDYVLVHFALSAPQPFFDGILYLGGDFTYNLMDIYSRMQYDNRTKQYQAAILLKQGGYNYQYRLLPKGAAKATLAPVHGSYWQTQNEYTIYVYHRGWGERYDRLVGVRSIE